MATEGVYLIEEDEIPGLVAMAVDTHARVKSAALEKFNQKRGNGPGLPYSADVDASHEIASAVVSALIQRYYWRMEQDA